jgi:hypothetical protein
VRLLGQQRKVDALGEAGVQELDARLLGVVVEVVGGLSQGHDFLLHRLAHKALHV